MTERIQEGADSVASPRLHSGVSESQKLWDGQVGGRAAARGTKGRLES